MVTFTAMAVVVLEIGVVVAVFHLSVRVTVGVVVGVVVVELVSVAHDLSSAARWWAGTSSSRCSTCPTVSMTSCRTCPFSTR